MQTRRDLATIAKLIQVDLGQLEGITWTTDIPQ